MNQAIHFRLLHSVPPPLPSPSPSSSKHRFSPNPSHKIPTFSPLNSLISPPAAHFPFLEKTLFLDSVGIDLFALIENHPPIVSSSLADLRAAVDFLFSLGFSSADLRRMCGMCPEILTAGGPPAFNAVLTFLLRDARVPTTDLCYVLSRRPRLLVSSVPGRLRPTLNFLQTLGVSHPARHAHLLSCSVEHKFLPRLEFLHKLGFSSMEARFMARRFPQIFCYSIKGNLEPKIEFFLGVMGREIREIKFFPQYFSFSLEKKIKPRHRVCEQNGVFFELPALLKPSDAEFQRRLDVCVSSSSPLRRSPLWKEGLSDDCL